MLRAEVHGLDELIADLDESAKRCGSQVDVWRMAGQILLNESRRRCPYRTGRLKSTIKQVPAATSMTLEAGGPKAPYAAQVEDREHFLDPEERDLDRVYELLAAHVLAPLEGGR